MERCAWCGHSNEKMLAYHDEEWGVPLHDEKKQFEFLMLEALQCGLSWELMIRKRDIFHACFDSFDFEKVACYGGGDIERILNTDGMLRSPQKIEAVIHNARCFLKLREEFGSFDAYLWGWSEGKVLLYEGHERGDIPAKNGLSTDIAADLKKRGFKYLGPTTVYSYLQACGLINDHQKNCFRYKTVMEGQDVKHLPRDREG